MFNPSQIGDKENIGLNSMFSNPDLNKAYEEGTYADTPGNRKLNRVGQKYGAAASSGSDSKENNETTSSKSENNISYSNLITKLKGDKISFSHSEKEKGILEVCREESSRGLFYGNEKNEKLKAFHKEITSKLENTGAEVIKVHFDRQAPPRKSYFKVKIKLAETSSSTESKDKPSTSTNSTYNKSEVERIVSTHFPSPSKYGGTGGSISYNHDKKIVTISSVRWPREARHPLEYGERGDEANRKMGQWDTDVWVKVEQPLKKLGYEIEYS